MLYGCKDLQADDLSDPDTEDAATHISGKKHKSNRVLKPEWNMVKVTAVKVDNPRVDIVINSTHGSKASATDAMATRQDFCDDVAYVLEVGENIPNRQTGEPCVYLSEITFMDRPDNSLIWNCLVVTCSLRGIVFENLSQTF